MKRRSFIKSVGATALITKAQGAGAVLSQAKLPGKKVAIFGGGMSGLSAAHELIERGFQVTIYEKKSIAGGKARSIPKPGTASVGRKDLPGEHGFRYFPGFYKHITDLMKRTPFPGNKNGCLDNLVEGSHLAILTKDKEMVRLPLKVPRTFEELREIIDVWFNRKEIGLSKEEITFFANKLFILATSCKQRRESDWEKVSWWDFIEAESKSDVYQRFLANGLTNLLVAMRPKDGSARTVGVLLLQQLLSFARPGEGLDQVLNGPTNEVWINPWVDYLKKKGVNFKSDTRLSKFNFNGKKITGAMIETNNKFSEVKANFYLLATPLDIALKVIDKDMRAFDPMLKKMGRLKDEWMVGIQFFMTKELDIAEGHMMYLDTPWALTSIHQKQFWKNAPLENYGDGTVKDVLSVDISNWGAKGVLYNKTARECTKQEIFNEVWAQLTSHLNRKENILLKADLKDWMLDPGIKFFDDGTVTNDEPLLINTVNSLVDRPTVDTKIPNFFLASDYVKTNTDLATMEAAAEASKRAVNAILDVKNSRRKRCKIWKLKEPSIFGPAKIRDYLRWKQGKPHEAI